jgi:hypothetical protein
VKLQQWILQQFSGQSMLCGCCEVQVLNGLLERPDWEFAIKLALFLLVPLLQQCPLALGVF